MQNNTTVISGFPGIGKTYLSGQSAGCYGIVDSDSSRYSWKVPNKERNPEFPHNYIEAIKGWFWNEYIKVVLVSSHKEVRDALVDNMIWFTLVYPHRLLKYEYLERFEKRGNNPYFVQLLDENWDNWIDELEGQTGCEHIVLMSGDYLSDVYLGD
jgi:adenylate kinase family enzyme